MLAAPADPMAFSHDNLVAIARALPADLRVLSKLGEILKDLNSEMDDVAKLLRTDVALAAKIMKISNSAMFGGGRAVATIEEAVNRVGFGEILRLVGTATAGRLSESLIPCYGIGAKLLRDNILYGAFAAEALARQAGCDARVAYNAGLLRSVGIMVLDRAGRHNSTPATMPLFTPARWPDFSTWEREIFGTVSSEVTANILDTWEFPAEVTATIRAHYLAEPGQRGNQLATVLNLANCLAQRVNRSFQGENRWWEFTPEKLSVAGLRVDHFEPAIMATEEAFHAASAALEA
jgi:HD-like signal output (HDOD) protein